ncbi:MAG TPA: carbohydrate ABC transporter permease [Thermofilum sp.]|nr:carbohydrate ABC transporter permease [Thermofilum sp.]
MRALRGKFVKKLLTYLAAITATVIMFFPVAYIALLSFKPYASIIMNPLGVDRLTLSNYIEVLSAPGYSFTQYIVNSVIISLGSTALALAIAFPAAYSIQRFKTGSTNLSFYILSLRLLPPIIFAVPLYILYSMWGLIDTHVGLILLYTTFNMPLTIFVLMSFIGELPLELEESALVDGASRLTVLTRIVFPLTLPGLVAASILHFMACWNEFLFALIFTLKNAQTVTVGASLYITAWQIKWGHIAAAISLSVTPTIIFILLVQRKLVIGLTMGALRG